MWLRNSPKQIFKSSTPMDVFPYSPIFPIFPTFTLGHRISENQSPYVLPSGSLHSRPEVHILHCLIYFGFLLVSFYKMYKLAIYYLVSKMKKYLQSYWLHFQKGYCYFHRRLRFYILWSSNHFLLLYVSFR